MTSGFSSLPPARLRRLVISSVAISNVCNRFRATTARTIPADCRLKHSRNVWLRERCRVRLRAANVYPFRSFYLKPSSPAVNRHQSYFTFSGDPSGSDRKGGERAGRSFFRVSVPTPDRPSRSDGREVL